MKKRKILALMLSLSLALSLAACGDSSASQQTTPAADGTDTQNSGSDLSATDDVSSDDAQEADGFTIDPEATVDEALEAVAQFNGCSVEELNYCYDDYGFVNFLGAGYTDQKIQSAEDAFDSLNNLISIAGIDGCEFIIYRTDVSPVSGYTYYTFTQIASSTVDDLPISYSNAQIRVIADAEGNSVGFSADILDMSEIPTIDYSNFVDQTEAEELVKSELTGHSKIISDLSELTYWDDESTTFEAGKGKIAPAWLIYTNASREGKPYTMYVVSASRNEDDQAFIMDRIATSQLNAIDDSYTSEIFFEGMQDAGTVTYEVDMQWAYDINNGYQGEEVKNVTVPIMYSEETGLYYLASYEDRIVVSNYYDFTMNNEVNALVSEDPSNLYSWQFAAMEGPYGESYFCDPAYLVSAYSTMLNTYYIYSERYGYNSVDTSGLPILLLTYMCDEYPEDVLDMTENACNMGQWHDWAVFATSPTYIGCVEVGCMAHEFAHGINSQLTNSQYLNEMGAVMEGYADSIGDNLSYLYGFKSEEYADYVGGESSDPIRSFANPYEFGSAKYIGGMYFLSPVAEGFPSSFDQGGVHSNSSVVNYLCYNLSHSDNPSDAVLDLGRTVDLFVETLYCATYNTGYDELGAYLIFAAGSMDLTEDEYSYVCDTINLLGFTNDYTRLNELIAEDNPGVYTVTVQDLDDQLLSGLYLGVLLSDYDDESAYYVGMINEEGSSVTLLPGTLSYQGTIYIIDPYSGEIIGGLYVDDVNPNEERVVPVNFYEAAPGEELDFGSYIGFCFSYNYDEGLTRYDDAMGQSVWSFDPGIYSMTLVDDDQNESWIVVSVSEE